MSDGKQPMPLNASHLQLEFTELPKPVPAPDSPEVASLKSTTDHMIVARWDRETGWGTPKLVPYGPLQIMPTASVLQYATECFEGMKVFRGFDRRLRLFRPIYNCRRLLASAQRVCLPEFDPEELLKLIHKICAIEAPKWLPKDAAQSALYIRPTLIASDSSIGFKVPGQATLCIFLMHWPVPKPSGSLPSAASQEGLALWASGEGVVRAWPGGTGAAKIGGNYGAALYEHARARGRGYDQVLWLYGPDRIITEAGAANVFVIWRTPGGLLQIATPPLDDRKLILAGGTRRSILELSREMFREGKGDLEKCEVVERDITIDDVQQANERGRLAGMFIVGTAYWVQPVKEVCVGETHIKVGVDQIPHISALKEKLADIVYGKQQSPWTDIVIENSISS